jgi:hypothetical protein
MCADAKTATPLYLAVIADQDHPDRSHEEQPSTEDGWWADVGSGVTASFNSSEGLAMSSGFALAFPVMHNSPRVVGRGPVHAMKVHRDLGSPAGRCADQALGGQPGTRRDVGAGP